MCPDVLYESARVNYDDAHEVSAEWAGGDVVGVATFPVDELWGGMPTGTLDPLPIRVYVLDVEGELAGEAGSAMTAYLDLGAARELRDTIDAAITQVELVRDRRRRGGVLDRARVR